MILNLISMEKNGRYQYLLVEPNRLLNANNIFTKNSISHTYSENIKNKEENIRSLNSSKIVTISLYDMLSEMRTSKTITYEDRDYTIYNYYFIGDYETNDITHQIETVNFELVKNKSF